jgi:carbon-monoxide dehydrogenase large subunit
VRGVPSRALSLERLAGWALSQGREAELHASEEFDAPDFVFPFGAHLAVVEVDRETGRVQILRYLAVDDCGVVINPMIVEGQVHGGTTQGIAQALLEEATFGPDGQLLTGNLTTYLMHADAPEPDWSEGHRRKWHPGRPADYRQRGDGRTQPAGYPASRHAADASEGLGSDPGRVQLGLRASQQWGTLPWPRNRMETNPHLNKIEARHGEELL